MRVEQGKLEGSLEVSDELNLQGMATGNVTVVLGGVLILNGMCCGNLLLESGSRVELHGMVLGDVLNRGGELAVYGIVNGSVRTDSGQTFVSPNAKIMRPAGDH
jgi:cytoskeletal protein CcmA (bactofilin family)